MALNTKILKPIPLVSCVLYIANFIAILAVFLHDPNGFLYDSSRAIKLSNWQVYAIILLIVTIVLSFCDILLILRGAVWSVETHTTEWLLWCFGKTLSLLVFATLFRHLYFLDNLASVTLMYFIYAIVCLVNSILHLLMFSAVLCICCYNHRSFCFCSFRDTVDGETLIGARSYQTQDSQTYPIGK